MTQHFVHPPQWEWYIVWYFFLGGIAGGAYVLGTLLRLRGDARDAEVSRLAFLIALPALAICPILLTLDLGRPLRFLHMLIDPSTWTLNFKYWSPMSVGAWVLTIFSVFAFVSFLDALGRTRILHGGFGRIFMIVGSFFGLFLAGYTGVLLSVSNQPIWSDTWALGGLFLASGLSVSAAAIELLARLQPDTAGSGAKLFRADRYFIILELALLVLFFVSLGSVGGMFLQPRWMVLWGVVLAGTVLPLLIRLGASAHRHAVGIVACVLVLIGGLALRIVVIFAAQM